MKGCSEVSHMLALIKGVYGLKDAPRAWRITRDILLKKLHAVPMKSDACLYMWHDKRGTLLGIASTHVDDLKCTGTLDALDSLDKELSKTFGKLKVEHPPFEHCGI